jgi:hypothetical protein
MSPEAITRRLRKVAQLRNLCLSLGKAGKAAASQQPVDAPDAARPSSNAEPAGNAKPASRD